MLPPPAPQKTQLNKRMNPTNPQDHPPGAGLSEESQVSIDELRYHLEGLRSLFVFALVALIVMTLTVDLFFIRRQMVNVRMQLDDQRPKVSDRVAGYKKSEPLARNFLASLQSFTNSNPDFQPTLERYRPYLYNLMMAGPAGSGSSTTPKASPGPSK